MLVTHSFALAVAAEKSATLLDQVLTSLGKVTSRQATFKEIRTLQFLTKPLRSKGTLIYKKPDYIYKETITPVPESYEVNAALLTVTLANGERHELMLSNFPVLESFVTAYRGVLAGDKTLLLYFYDIQFKGNQKNWIIILTPKGEAAQQHVDKMVVKGSDNHLRKITTYEMGGDVTVMGIFDIQ